MELKKYKLSELLTIKNGKDHKHLNNGKYPVFGSGGIMRYVNEYLYDKPSILLPRKGSLSNIQFSDTPFWCVDTTYYSEINIELANPYYLFYYIKLLDLTALDSGTGLPSMTFDSYYNIPVELPEITCQNKIASVLSSLDRKIALNRRINAKLEQIAKRLYDYWFVQFNFPDKNGKPYKSNGGKMVWNEVLKREVPEGWEVKKIEKILDKYPSTKRYNTSEYLQNGKYPIVDQDSSKFIAGYTNEDSELLKRFPTVLFGDHSTCVKFINFEFCRGADGTQILYSRDNCVKPFYLYLTISEMTIPNPGYSRHFKYLKELPIISPAIEYANKFEDIVFPLYQQKTKLDKEITNLTSLRDKLLPLLMNGQLEVKG